jgi:hypothetical protein
MQWQVLLHPSFAGELSDFPAAVQDELAALIRALQHLGPHLKRPAATHSMVLVLPT